jgi:hypothetical protein
MKMRFYVVSFTVQGSHREGNKQNKELSALTHQTNSNLNNPNSLSGSKSVAPATTTTTDSDVNHSGPYFDVAASKNVCITHMLALARSLLPHNIKLFPKVAAIKKKPKREQASRTKKRVERN